MPKMRFNDFYCISCGNKSLTLPRKESFKHERFHRKKLYCYRCQMEINHVECQNEEDAYNFKLDFEDGVYDNEKEESLAFIRDTRQW